MRSMGPYTTHNGSLNASQLRGVSCAICSKFTKKLLECALPVTPTTGQSAQDAFFAAAKSCATADWDKVLYE